MELTKEQIQKITQSVKKGIRVTAGETEFLIRVLDTMLKWGEGGMFIHDDGELDLKQIAEAEKVLTKLKSIKNFIA